MGLGDALVKMPSGEWVAPCHVGAVRSSVFQVPGRQDPGTGTVDVQVILSCGAILPYQSTHGVWTQRGLEQAEEEAKKLADKVAPWLNHRGVGIAPKFPDWMMAEGPRDGGPFGVMDESVEAMVARSESVPVGEVLDDPANMAQADAGEAVAEVADLVGLLEKIHESGVVSSLPDDVAEELNAVVERYDSTMVPGSAVLDACGIPTNVGPEIAGRLRAFMPESSMADGFPTKEGQRAVESLVLDVLSRRCTVPGRVNVKCDLEVNPPSSMKRGATLVQVFFQPEDHLRDRHLLGVEIVWPTLPADLPAVWVGPWDALDQRYF